jgi:hypothetical protein
MRYSALAVAAMLMPLAAVAQQDPAGRLSEVLPPEVAEQVLERVETARAAALPAQAVANLALEGVAKGRTAAEVLAAVELLVADMGRARDALQTAEHQPAAGEIEAATQALRMGVDGAAVSELARSAPPGRSLTVPLLVLGSLAQRGLPSDQALAAVQDRLAARVPDAELLSTFGAPGGARGGGGPPAGVGPGAAGGRGGPPGGVGVPVGPQDDAGRPPVGRGRGGLPGN